MKKSADCKYCGLEFTYYPGERRGLYCSQLCKNEWLWINQTRPSIIQGTISVHSVGSIRRYLSERDGLRCAICGQSDSWAGLPLTLQIDHIDGDRKNNRGSNLRFLDPNCHSQQPTSYRRKT